MDTATRAASVALYDETGVVAEVTWRTRENHTTNLVPQIVRLLELAGSRSVDVRVENPVGAVGVATGPGSFTGLRVGLAAAKGLALGLGVPIIGVPTLDGLAQAFAQQPLSIWAVLQVGRGRFVTAPYAPRRGARLVRSVRREGDYVVGAAADLAAAIEAWLNVGKDARVLLCGEIDAPLRATLLAQLPGRVVLAHPANNARRAAYLAELAWTRWQTGDIDDLATLTPYYIPTLSLPVAAP